MGATLKDVANLAEVSTATVSYVLNNGPRPVSSATRNKVLDAIDQLGYQPRRKRRANTSPHTLTIGVIVPNANATFFGDALDGIEAFLCSHGHNCLVASSRSDLAIERRAIRQMAKLVDGFIITPSASLHPDILRLSDSGTTIVLMDRQVNASAFSGVGIDNYSITAQAVDLLYDGGRRRIALINGPQEIDTVRARLEGYKDSLAAVGLPYNPEWVAHVPFTSEAGRNVALDLLSAHTPPDAFICSSTDLTVGVLHTINQLGLTMPDDVALVCYGDTEWTSLLSPAVTVIDAPARLMGETAARLLLNAHCDPENAETRHIFLETRPILRDTHRRQRAAVRRKLGN